MIFRYSNLCNIECKNQHFIMSRTLVEGGGRVKGIKLFLTLGTFNANVNLSALVFFANSHHLTVTALIQNRTHAYRRIAGHHHGGKDSSFGVNKPFRLTIIR